MALSHWGRICLPLLASNMRGMVSLAAFPMRFPIAGEETWPRKRRRFWHNGSIDPLLFSCPVLPDARCGRGTARGTKKHENVPSHVLEHGCGDKKGQKRSRRGAGVPRRGQNHIKMRPARDRGVRLLQPRLLDHAHDQGDQVDDHAVDEAVQRDFQAAEEDAPGKQVGDIDRFRSLLSGDVPHDG